MAARPDHVDKVHPHDTKQVFIDNKSKRNSSVESYHQEEGHCHVKLISTRHSRIISLDFHVILEDNLFPFLTLLGNYSYSINSIVLPSASDRLSIHVSEPTISMLDIVDPLAFILDPIGCHENTVAMSHVLIPVSSVVGFISPSASADINTHALLITLPLVLTPVIHA